MTKDHVTPIRAVTLAPFYYHSHAVPSGTATMAQFISDKAMSFALMNAMGGLRADGAMPNKDYRRDLSAMPWLCSVFEAENPSLLKPSGRRLNLDAEGGYPRNIQNATQSGNLKTWFYIQEVAPGVVYNGAVFGQDPFELASEALETDVNEIIVRIGRHRSGVMSLRRAGDDGQVRLNSHTAWLFGKHPDTDPRLAVKDFVLYEMQVTAPLPIGEAAELVQSFRVM